MNVVQLKLEQREYFTFKLVSLPKPVFFKWNRDCTSVVVQLEYTSLRAGCPLQGLGVALYMLSTCEGLLSLGCTELWSWLKISRVVI